MRASHVLLATALLIFAVFFFDARYLLNDRVDSGGSVALGAFELFGATVSLYLISRGNLVKLALPDLLGCAARDYGVQCTNLLCFGAIKYTQSTLRGTIDG
jgi:hypothetical protein